MSVARTDALCSELFLLSALRYADYMSSDGHGSMRNGVWNRNGNKAVCVHLARVSIAGARFVCDQDCCTRVLVGVIFALETDFLVGTLARISRQDKADERAPPYSPLLALRASRHVQKNGLSVGARFLRKSIPKVRLQFETITSGAYHYNDNDMMIF